MYSRDFGNIRSEGTLYNMEHGFYDPVRDRAEEERGEREAHAEKPRRPLAAGLLDSLRELKLDDLLIIAIGILLLLDSGSDNDMIVLLIAAMLLF
ncbi:MAG: hypothetical protein J6252_02415 [Clostridia bacterium]|nr:hypothetical protein [Clostridia bacterium]